MGQRLELQTVLESILGSRNVYFQPPANIIMSYPAIVYSRNRAETLFADSSPYRYTKGYVVTYIDRNPDSPIPDKIAMLPMCTFSNHFVNDNLHHDAFTIYF